MKLPSPFPLALLAAAFLRGEVSTSPQPSPPAAHPCAWLEGRWVGAGLGGEVEETWLAPRGGAMVGVFRMASEERVSFYELMTIEEGPDGPQMRLKHFHADLRGWEERDESLVWPYESLGDRAARFGPVTYDLVKDGVLRATVEIEQGGEVTTEELRFRRAE